MKKNSFRLFVNRALHDPRTKSARIINGFLIFLIIFSIAVIPLHFMKALDWAHEPLFFFDRFVITVFTIEYALRIWSARNPKGYITSWWGIIDVAAILPFYLAKFSFFATPQVFLILRILRILKLGRAYDIERMAIKNCSKSSHGEFKVIPGEEIERVVQKHPIILLLSLSLPLALTSIALLIIVFFKGSYTAIAFSTLFFFFAFIFFLKSWLDYNFDVIYITNKRVIVQNRELFGAISNDIAYEAITNVVPNNTGLLHWLLGFGDVQIETAARDDLHFHDAPRPHRVVQHISINRQKTFQSKVRLTGSQAPQTHEVGVHQPIHMDV